MRSPVRLLDILVNPAVVAYPPTVFRLGLRPPPHIRFWGVRGRGRRTALAASPVPGHNVGLRYVGLSLLLAPLRKLLCGLLDNLAGIPDAGGLPLEVAYNDVRGRD